MGEESEIALDSLEQQWFQKFAKILNETRTSYATHNRKLKELVTIRSKLSSSESSSIRRFSSVFFKTLTPLFIAAQRRTAAAERVVRFVAEFACLRSNLDDDSECDEFLDEFLKFLMAGSVAANINARFRACQIISEICSLRMMFESAQFKDNFSLFQQLIADGVFDMSSSSGAKLEDIRTFKKLALSDFNKSRLVESYHLLKEREKGTGDSVTTTSRSSNPNVPKNIVTIKRHCEDQTQLKSESRGLMRSPKRVMKMKANHESKVMTENNVSCFSPRSLVSVFAQEGGSALCGYEGNCSSDQDLLLLDLPSNGSFPQAELLHQL